MQNSTGWLVFALLFGIVGCDSIYDGSAATPEEPIDPPDFPPLHEFEYRFGVLDEVEAGFEMWPLPDYDELEEPHLYLAWALNWMRREIEEEMQPALDNVFSQVEVDEGKFNPYEFTWEFVPEVEFYGGSVLSGVAELSAEVPADTSLVNWQLLLNNGNSADGSVTILTGYSNREQTDITWSFYAPEETPGQKLAELAYTFTDGRADSIRVSTDFEAGEDTPRRQIRYNPGEEEADVHFFDHAEPWSFMATYRIEEGDGQMEYTRGENSEEYCWNEEFDIVGCE